MPRRPRIQVAGATYHITSRGNRRQPVFTDNRSRERFLALLADVVFRMRWEVFAYCLMTNHYHLVVRTPEPNLARGMERLNGMYARWFNWRHGYAGHLFDRRYHDELVERDAHLIELTRYVALNPVRAKLCAHPAEWMWSSYPATATNVGRPDFLSDNWVFDFFGATPADARRHYAEFVTRDLRRT